MIQTIETALIIEATTILLNLPKVRNLEKIASAVLETSKRGNTVYFSGMGKCDSVAEKLSATYSSIGIPSCRLSCSNALHGDIGKVKPDDLVVLFSKSGSTKETVKLAKELPKFGAVGLAITCTPNSELSKYCSLELVLDCPNEADALNLAPTASTTLMLAVGDAIGIGVSASLGFSREEFGRSHPSGKLGEDINGNTSCAFKL